MLNLYVIFSYYRGFLIGMRRLPLVLVLVLGLYTPLLGQQVGIDSLLTLLTTTHAVIPRVDLLNKLSSAYYDHDVNKGLEYASEAYSLAVTKQYTKGMRYALILKGYYYYEIGAYAEALDFYRQATAVKTPDDDLLGYNFVMTGNLYLAKARYDSAHHYYQRAIELLLRIRSERYLAFAYRNMGRLNVLQWRNDEAETYFNKALELYQRGNSPYGKAQVSFALAELSKNRARYKQARDYVSEGCRIAGELNDEHLRLYCLINEGEIRYRLGEYLEALELLLQAVELLSKKDVPRTLSQVYGDLSNIYETLGQNDVALRYALEGLKIADRLGIPYEIAMLQSNIAWLYKKQRSFASAFDFIDRSLQLRMEIGDEFGVANSHNIKGVIYYEQNKFDEAKKWLNESLTIRKRINHIEGVSICLYNLALVFEKQKQYRKALAFHLKALEIEKTIGNKYNLGYAYNSIGSVYLQLKHYDSAAVYLEQARKLGQETGSLYLQMDNSAYWSRLLEAEGNMRQALEWHKRYANLNDSIYDENSATKLAEMQALYQTDQKDQQIELLRQEKLLQGNELQLHKAKINLQNIVIISVVGGFILVSLLAFKTYQYNQQIRKAHQAIMGQKEELEAQSKELKDAYHIIEYINKKLEAKVEDKSSALLQAYKELDTFFYRASHDFRRPLTTFLGLAEVAHISVQDPNALELFSKVKDTARNLDKMLLKLQSISDMGSQQPVYGEVDMSRVFNDLLGKYREDLERQNIKVSSSVVVSHAFYSVPALVYIIVDNLLENAINFSRYENAFIRMSARLEGQRLVVEVEDNGEGIAPDYHDAIFEMYFRGSERSKGNGLGLYIVRKAIEKLSGHVRIISEAGKGALFRVVFKPHTG